MSCALSIDLVRPFDDVVPQVKQAPPAMSVLAHELTASLNAALDALRDTA